MINILLAVFNCVQVRCHTFGAVCDGAPLPIVALVHNDAHYANDTNLAISALHRTLCLQAERKQKWIDEDEAYRVANGGKSEAQIQAGLQQINDEYERKTGRKRCVVWPSKLYLQADNGSPNKSNAFFHYLGWLKHAGIFDKIRVSYMMVGHTHDIVDQVFSRISWGLKRRDCLSVQEYLQRLPEFYAAVSAKHVSKAQYKAGNAKLNERESDDMQVTSPARTRTYTHCQ